MSVRQRRIDKGWSQSQLAEFCGLSLRTVQRIEKGHKATAETLKSFAAVFEINVSELIPAENKSESDLSELEVEALMEVRKMKKFYLELLSFLLTMPFVYLANSLFDPSGNWAGLVAFSWGIWIAYEAYDVFEASGILGSNWEKRQMVNRLGKVIN